ncbi:MAG TPA: antitoxin VbhA family protein [Kineosporiaceae bacterium]|nr:antitoxin VbhA family protein [Kineosporiaceae bacterium]
MSITPEEQARRAEDARRIRHSTEMEGGRTPDATMADQDAYVRGEIDEDEMVRRFRERYGLPQ